jgi:hypothetical protein
MLRLTFTQKEYAAFCILNAKAWTASYEHAEQVLWDAVTVSYKVPRATLQKFFGERAA